jgi:hypothetical protein
MLKKKNGYQGTTGQSMGWEDALFFNWDTPAGTSKKPIPKITRQILLKNRCLRPITKIREK